MLVRRSAAVSSPVECRFISRAASNMTFWPNTTTPIGTYVFICLFCYGDWYTVCCYPMVQAYYSAGIKLRSTADAPSGTHAHPFNGPLSGTTQVSRYQKGKTNLDFTEARDSKWQ